jgi:hypothetical protein
MGGVYAEGRLLQPRLKLQVVYIELSGKKLDLFFFLSFLRRTEAHSLSK